MPQSFHVVAVIGSTSERSRTQALAEAIVASLAAQVPIDIETLLLRELAPHIGAATERDAIDADGQHALQAIERCDLLIVATPVYKGCYPGIFKHLIDFIPPDVLVGRPVLLAATGGSDRHALVVDHSLRPLFSFFRAQSVPSAVYASHADFDGLALKNPALQARIDEAATQAALLLRTQAQRAALADAQLAAA